MSCVLHEMGEAGRPGYTWLLRQVHRAVENGLSRLSFHPKRAHRDVRPQLCSQCGAGSMAVVPNICWCVDVCFALGP